MSDLVLHLKKKYFDQIKSGEKKFEYRLKTPYWSKRLAGRQYNNIRLLCGYPKRGDKSREIVRKFRGYETQIISHPEFGEKPVRVFAIPVSAK